ncbi:MAG: VWA domain-containing protein [Caldilineaceae bacterium]|nr:VWA domain-containing protein [Caldilineaceae bacterium]
MNHEIHEQPSTAETTGRRNVLKALGATGIAVATITVLPNEWIKPVINIGALPVHALGSPLGLPPVAQSICPPTPADIMLTVDTSGSIADDIANSRAALLAFVNSRNLSNDRIGLVSFDTAPLSFLALSQDKGAIDNTINNLTTGGMTSIAVGIDRSTNELKTGNLSGNQRILILLSDGGANDPTRFTPRQSEPIGFPEARDAANNAKAAGIRIITIAIGTQNIVTNQASLNLVIGFMRDIASSPSDFYFVENLSQLIAALTACN